MVGYVNILESWLQKKINIKKQPYRIIICVCVVLTTPIINFLNIQKN